MKDKTQRLGVGTHTLHTYKKKGKTRRQIVIITKAGKMGGVQKYKSQTRHV